MIALFIEIFIFNINYFTKGYKNTAVSEVTTENLEILDKDYYLIEDDEAFIILKDINQFVGQLEFETNSLDKNVDIQIAYNNKVKTDNIYTTDKKSIVINDTVDSIKISFTNEKGQEIRIKDIQIVNEFQFNFIRFFIILLLFGLLGVIYYAFRNRKKLNWKLYSLHWFSVLAFYLQL